MLSAGELHQRGVVATNAGRYATARRLLRLALTRVGDDPRLSAEVESSLAHLEAETGDSEAALERCGAVLDRSSLPQVTRASVLSQRGMLLMLAGRTQEALADFNTAGELLDDEDDLLGRIHLNRGGVHLRHEDLPAAERDFAAATPHLLRAGMPTEAAMAQHNLGYCRFLAGDLVTALGLMDAAAPVLAPLSPVSEAVGQQDRAEALLAAGLVGEGRRALEAAARAYGSRRLRRRQGEAELSLARALVAAGPDEAGRLARSSARRFRDAGAPAMARRAEAVRLAAERRSGTTRTRWLTDADELAAALAEDGARWDAVVVGLHAAAVAAARGDLVEARERIRRTPRRREAPLAVRLVHAETAATIDEVAGRSARALGHLRAGLADLHAWQSSFGSLDLQTGVAGAGVRLGVRGLALAVESRRPAVLLEWSERARMLASRVQPVRAPEDPELAADLAELRGGPSAAREAELRQRVRERAWQHRGSGEVADPVTLDALREALDADSALVAYVVTADAIVALVVTPDAATWVDLGGRADLDALLGGLLPDLDVAAADLPEPMAGAVRGALAVRLDELARLLVAPVLDAVGDRRVVLTPSGVLAGVPWTLLPGYVGRPVTVAQSATSWLARRTTPLRTATAGFVAGPRVVRAEDEVNAAAKEWRDARVLVGTEATADAVSELAEQVDVLHVAAHGRHSAENPLFSGLLLADGSWFGYDVDRLRSVPDVVLLSACEVGRSTVRWGEELIGMSAAWLHAGARCVIASAAAVNDAAAYDVLVAVHQQLAAGVDPATALAAAVPAVSTGTAPVPLVCFG
ncbi:CHAT domain-containing protein [Nocardioides lianchengensis]|uniref:CHAT domain-containing protein n=1 Tax=Nocardioides lianchengensis TaxID=1045774 RepID=A0A1G6LH14_9ACTN|nr:CHAT domain-containing protein [Nocardioides lianchengensis]NYG12558.1 tetratricopeptide (TPR) repeat protein [Nocardioides lianchengensis]SDC42519.1 CHAT domain-containing protein [Nocardioides lianchengensis]